MTFAHILTYIDPGSGSLLIQVILASFLSIASFSRRIRDFFMLFIRNFLKKAKD